MNAHERPTTGLGAGNPPPGPAQGVEGREEANVAHDEVFLALPGGW